VWELCWLVGNIVCLLAMGQHGQLLHLLLNMGGWVYMDVHRCT
jgi:hypothetical protein